MEETILLFIFAIVILLNFATADIENKPKKARNIFAVLFIAFLLLVGRGTFWKIKYESTKAQLTDIQETCIRIGIATSTQKITVEHEEFKWNMD